MKSSPTCKPTSWTTSSAVRSRNIKEVPTPARVQGLNHAEVLERAEGLVPVLAERARETELLRRIPDETVHDLRQAGLLRLANPERFGGHGLDYDTVLEVTAILGRACG